MVKSTKITKLLTAYLFVVSISSVAAESGVGKELLEKQQKQMDELLVDMNKTGKDLYDEITNEPQGVVESGCLGSIRDIDLSVVPIDPMGILGAVYAAIKDQITDLSCSAAKDFAEQANNELTGKLETPFGIVSLEASNNPSEDQGIFKPNVIIDNEKVGKEVTEEVLEGVRNNSYNSSSGLNNTSIKEYKSNNKPRNSKDVEKKLENVIDVNKIWGGDGEDSGGDNDNN